MTELFRKTWVLGWKAYTSGGKIAVLLLVVLMVFWFADRKWKTRHATLGIYTTVMAVLCICPLTAAMLMTYQTRFYDYQWIWNLVPGTIFIALMGTYLWTMLTDGCFKNKKNRWKGIGITLVMLAVIYFSGGMGKTVLDVKEETAKQAEAEAVLGVLTEEEQSSSIILWAPQRIMEYTRMLDGNIRLVYGRNMWDDSLNAYTYDIYGGAEKDMYAWMSNLEETGEGQIVIESDEKENVLSRTVTGRECVDSARKLGVTHILLPDIIQPDVLAEVEEYLRVKAEKTEGYYMLSIN